MNLTIWAAIFVFAAFFIFAISYGIKIQSKKVSTGPEGLIGLKGKVSKMLNPEGFVYLRGELWKARAVDGNHKKNTIVEVTEVRGNLLLIKEAEVDEG
ncbi:MAG: NfeD family protein [Elusimicrobiota bacterium]|nr:NfeD family protein [Elusimicrobiota bacterium]